MSKSLFTTIKETFSSFKSLPVAVEADRAPHYDVNRFPLGISAKGEVISWDPFHSPHLLATGPAGSGKTNLIRNLIAHAATYADQWSIVGIDFTGQMQELSKNGEHVVLGVATNVEDGLEACAFAMEEMMNRYQRLEEHGVNNIRDLKDGTKNLLLIVDSAATFLTPSGVKTDEGQTEDEKRQESLLLLGNIARLGRAAGIFVVLATQRPDANIIHDEFKQNLSTRIVLGKVDSIHSQMTLKNDNATAIDAKVKGRAYVQSMYENGQEVQTYLATQEWLENR